MRENLPDSRMVDACHHEDCQQDQQAGDLASAELITKLLARFHPYSSPGLML